MKDVLGIRSLNMLKMEKNFIAVLEKKYPRKPYDTYKIEFLFDRLDEELLELHAAIRKEGSKIARMFSIMNEIADMSNILDYMYENILGEVMLE